MEELIEPRWTSALPRPSSGTVAGLSAAIVANARIIDARLTRPARWRGSLRRDQWRYGTAAEHARAAAAFDWLRGLSGLPHPPEASVDLLREIHDRAVGGRAFRVESIRVAGHFYPRAAEVEAGVQRVFAEHHARPRDATTDAARLHAGLLVVHPFRDGNGRSTRLLATYVLLRAGLRSSLLTAVEQHFETAPRQYLAALDLYYSAGPDRAVAALLHGMLSRSAVAAWFRARVVRLRGRALATVKQPDGSYSYSAPLSVWADISTNYPGWTNMPDNQAMQQAWADLLAAARAHEQAHVDMITSEVALLSGSLATGSGPTPDAAFAQAMAQANGAVQQLNDRITRKGYEYDLKTSHGANEAAVGGKNIKLQCPPGT